tara:strand:+ start:347 stop:1882 length:1536 start_codon:yes stop_codon:yes gene_type:complete
MIEVEEVIYRWRQGMSTRRIAHTLGIARNTVRRLITQAQQTGLTVESTESDLETLKNNLASLRCQQVKNISKRTAYLYFETHHAQIIQWREMPHMTVSQMIRLFQEKGKKVSETSLRRYLHEHFPVLPTSTVHLETIPGQQAQVDFGYMGLMFDSLTQRQRKAYAFIMTLSHSRYRFVHFVFGQDIATWIDCHRRAFQFFGGVPLTIMLDNLKAGVIKAHIYDPILNRTYGECERHYGFMCDPNKIKMPRHKGKVERSVSLVRQQILAGRTFKDIIEANSKALQWCREEIATRVCRSTGRTPLDIFENEEKVCLKPLPLKEYEAAHWQELKVHRDHHVVFEGSYYSVPTAYIGKKIWLRASLRMIEIYSEHQKIKVHIRSSIRGKWVTDQQDYPESKRLFLENNSKSCLKQAQLVGPFTAQFMEKILEGSTVIGQRKAQAILRLRDHYGHQRLEAACQRSVGFDNFTHMSLKNILNHGLEKVPDETQCPIILGQETSYLRSSDIFLQGEQL